jgi:hypothetical protein
VVVVPRAAVQSIGERTVLYLPVKDEEGKFVRAPCARDRERSSRPTCWR